MTVDDKASRAAESLSCAINIAAMCLVRPVQEVRLAIQSTPNLAAELRQALGLLETSLEQRDAASLRVLLSAIESGQEGEHKEAGRRLLLDFGLDPDDTIGGALPSPPCRPVSDGGQGAPAG